MAQFSCVLSINAAKSGAIYGHTLSSTTGSKFHMSYGVGLAFYWPCRMWVAGATTMLVPPVITTTNIGPCETQKHLSPRRKGGWQASGVVSVCRLWPVSSATHRSVTTHGYGSLC